jgi:hypothetical protein
MVSLEAGTPAEGAGDEDVDVLGPANADGPLDLVLQVAQVGDGGGGDVGDAVGHGDQGDRFLPWPKTLPGSGPTGMVVAVRTAGGVAEERCTPVFM